MGIPVTRKMTRGIAKVLLLFLQRASFKQFYRYVEPIGLMTLAAALDRHGYCPRVFTGSITDALPLLENMYRKEGVQAIALYCDYENQNVVESFARTAKGKYSVPVFAGGPQGYFLEAGFLRSSLCDAVGRGEGEQTLPELLDFFVKGKGSLQEIAGITFLDATGQLIRTPDRPAIEDLDALPVPRAEFSLTGKKTNLAVLTGRGCPFRCAFCFEGGNTRNVRLRSVQSVREEIEQGFRDSPGIRYVWFADDTFTLNPRRVTEFCGAMKELRGRHDFVWFCDAHPSLIVKWPDMLPEMIEAGLVRMQIGIETGSAKVVQLYGKSTDLTQIEQVVDLCVKQDLPQLCGNIIFGGAMETPETLAETEEFVTRLLRRAPGMLDITHTLYTPFPGTTMTQSPERFGIRPVDSASVTSTGDYPVAATTGLSREHIAGGRRRFSRQIRQLMWDLTFQGGVPHARIRRHYELYRRYGISSTWHSLVYSQHVNFDRRFTLLGSSSARSLCEIPREELRLWRPVRIPYLGNTVDFRKEPPELLGMPITPAEYQVILYCTGKFSIGELLERHEGSGRWKEQWPQSEAEMIRILQELENRQFLIFTRY